MRLFTDEEGNKFELDVEKSERFAAEATYVIKPIKAVEDLGASATPDKAKQPSVSKSLTEASLLVLMNEYAAWNWERITANDGPEPEYNYTSYAGFANWLRRRVERNGLAAADSSQVKPGESATFKSSQSTTDSELDGILNLAAHSATGDCNIEVSKKLRAEAKAKLEHLIAQEANKAVVAELKKMGESAADLEGKAINHYSKIHDRINALTADKESTNA